MSVENQSKKKYEFQKQSAPPKDVVDVASQTDSSEKEDGSCQTENPERKDVQVQTNGPKQSEPIATQTENSPKCDFQSQANIQREGSCSSNNKRRGCHAKYSEFCCTNSSKETEAVFNIFC